MQQVKGPALPLKQLRSLLWHGFNPCLGNFHMPRVWPKKGVGGVQNCSDKWEKEAVLSVGVSRLQEPCL